MTAMTAMTAMNATADMSDIPDEILDQAIALLVKLRASGHKPVQEHVQDDALRAEITAWCAAHPLHALVWQELQAGEAEFARLKPLPMSAAVLTGTLDVVHQNRKVSSSRRKTLRLLCLGATGVGIGALAMNQFGVMEKLGDFGADYASGTGEQRVVNLADGTQVKLNTDSAFDVRYSDSRRVLLLRHGEIFIATGTDTLAASRRSFWVETRQARLQALGTQFLVHQEAQQTRLTVTEGRVAIYHEAQLNAVARAGDSFLIDADGSATLLPASTQMIDPTGWTDNALVVKQMPLRDFLNELGRYRSGWLRCDPQIADLLVSGVFQIGDTDLALQALTRALPVRIERRTRYWVSLLPA